VYTAFTNLKARVTITIVWLSLSMDTNLATGGTDALALRGRFVCRLASRVD
jgi:hypothetical protein